MRWFFGLCAGAVLGLSVSAVGCGGSFQNPQEPGGSKGPEMRVTAQTGRAISGSASQMAQSPAPFVAPPTPSLGFGGTSVDAGTD